MNIILISPLPPPAGGIATWTKMVLESDQGKENNIDLVNTSVIGNRTTNLKNKKLTEEIKRTYKIIKELRKKTKNKTDSIVHLNSACSKTGLIRDYICAKIAKKRNILIVHYRCDVTYMVKGTLAKFFFKRITKMANKIIVLNKISKEYIKNQCEKDSILLPNFINDEEFDLDKEKKINDQIKTILFAGHITRQKGCDTIIEVAKKMPEIEFKLVGNISEEIKNMKVTKNVIFLGEMKKAKVIEEMKKADVFLFPTHTEGFPNVIAEAMAAGLPIISSDVAAIPDMLENKGGIINKDYNSESYIKAINKIKEKKIRKEMSKWNISKVKNCYVKNKIINQLFDIYKEEKEKNEK